ncbi:MAG: tetratricopeptide repeat protein [Candidatus Obscuribacterales bacterium]|nr:tetratricopeptide repeat protein [Candidatus Obscuribacterales bacterium]
MKFANVCIMLFAAIAVSSPSLAAESWDSVIQSANQAESGGNFQAADKSYQRAIQLSSAFPQPDIRYAISCGNLGMLYSTKGKLAEAEGLYKKSLATLKLIAAPEAKEAKTLFQARALSGLGAVYAQLNRLPEAEASLKQSIAISSSIPEKGNQDLASALDNLAWVYQRQNKSADAIDTLKKALDFSEKSSASASDKLIITGKITGNLAVLLSEQGNVSEAEKYAQKCIHSYTSAGATAHPNMAEAFKALATIAFKKGNIAEAEELSLKALKIEEAQLGEDHERVASSYNNLAMLLAQNGKYLEAISYLGRAITILEKRPEQNATAIASCRSNLTAIMQREKESRNQGAAAGDEFKSIESLLIKSVHASLAGQLDNAEALCRQAIARADKEPNLLELATAGRQELMLLLSKQKKYDAVVSVGHELLKLMEKEPVPQATDAVDVKNAFERLTYTRMAQAYMAQKKNAEAELSFKKALDIPTGIIMQQELAELYRSYAEFLSSHGRKSEGDSFLKKAESIK